MEIEFNYVVDSCIKCGEKSLIPVAPSTDGLIIDDNTKQFNWKCVSCSHLNILNVSRDAIAIPIKT